MSKYAVSIKETQRGLPELVKLVKTSGLATITRHEKAVAYVIGADALRSMIETAEILADPTACAAIADAEANRGRVYTLDEIED